MNMVFKKATAKYQFEYIDVFNNMAFYDCVLEENEVYQIVEIHPPIKDYKKTYKYELLMDGDVSNCYNKRHLLITEDMINECFRLPRKNHWEIKLFTNENECNDFLKGLESDCLKDVKFTENQIMVIYLVKGDEDK